MGPTKSNPGTLAGTSIETKSSFVTVGSNGARFWIFSSTGDLLPLGDSGIPKDPQVGVMGAVASREDGNYLAIGGDNGWGIWDIIDVPRRVWILPSTPRDTQDVVLALAWNKDRVYVVILSSNGGGGPKDPPIGPPDRYFIQIWNVATPASPVRVGTDYTLPRYPYADIQVWDSYAILSSLDASDSKTVWLGLDVSNPTGISSLGVISGPDAGASSFGVDNEGIIYAAERKRWRAYVPWYYPKPVDCTITVSGYPITDSIHCVEVNVDQGSRGTQSSRFTLTVGDYAGPMECVIGCEYFFFFPFLFFERFFPAFVGMFFSALPL